MYIGKDVCIKTHKRKGKQLVDPGDLVSEKSLAKVYKILGKVIIFSLNQRVYIFLPLRINARSMQKFIRI